MVRVLVFGQTLRQSVDDPEFECTIIEPISVRNLLEAHPENFSNLLPLFNAGQLMVTVNQKISTLETMVKDGDLLKLTHQINPDFEGALWHNP